jgi:SLOG cluster2
MPQDRPLEGMAVGISISEAENLASTGFTPADISLVTVELCRRIVALGAQVVLGHQWRPGGIMEQVTRFAQAYHMESGGSQQPIVHNVMAWPDKASLSEYDREQLRDLVRIYEPERPEERANALTSMRHHITQIAKARICLSGKMESYSGSMPGLIEEALLSMDEGQPVYISAMMGGAAATLIECIRGSLEINALLPQPGQVPRKIQHYFYRSRDRENEVAFAKLCQLYPHELDELFRAQNLDTIIQLSTRGMSRLNGTLQDWEPNRF